MIYRNRKGRHSTKRADRATHYGNVKETAVVKADVKALPAATTKPSSQPKYSPVSDEVTPYGAKKFRTPYKKDEFTGVQGTPILAGILDIDGTLQGWGHSADKDVLKWVEKVTKLYPDMVWLVITARDHGTFGYDSSFNWLMHAFPYPFIGPFARAKDDPRFASEFKRELAQGFEDMGLYQIVAAADDNKFVIDMWKAWAVDHFEDPKEFELFEASYGAYDYWRSGLPDKGNERPSYANSSYSSKSYTDLHKDEHWEQAASKYVPNKRVVEGIAEIWIAGKNDPVTKAWINGHWEVAPAPGGGKSLTEDPAWQSYFAQRYDAPIKSAKAGKWPSGNLNVVSTSPNETAEDILDEIIGEIADRDDYALLREDLENIVSHADPTLTPAEIEEMSISTLREKAGLTDEDYRETLIDEINRLFGEDRYSAFELGVCTLDELEDLIGMDTIRADGFIDKLIDDLNLDTPPIGDPDIAAHIRSKSARIELEDEVWAAYPEVTAKELQAMDMVDLQAMLDELGPDTEALDVAEVLAELDDGDPHTAPWPLGGKTYVARGGKLVELEDEAQNEWPLQQQSPRYEAS